MRNNFTSSIDLLRDLNDHIENAEPFSNIRLGDGCSLTILHYLYIEKLRELCRRNGLNLFKYTVKLKKVLKKKRYGRYSDEEFKKICRRVITHSNKSNYIDRLDSFYEYTNYGMDEKNVEMIIVNNWKEVWAQIGITNENYCSMFANLYSIIKDEYNIFDVAKGRDVFCISNEPVGVEKFSKFSGAKKVDSHILPKSHYDQPLHFKKVCKIIKSNASKYDLFIVGAGFLGKIYLGLIKQNGGRGFDGGRCFNIWADGGFRPRKIIADGIFEVDEKTKMMYRRIKK